MRNKAKEEKLRNRQKLCSQERIVDDSELIDEDDSHIEIYNKNCISKGKDLKTIDSINKSIKVKTDHPKIKGGAYTHYKESRNKKCRSPIEKLRMGDRKSSISLLVKPNLGVTKTLAIDAF